MLFAASQPIGRHQPRSSLIEPLEGRQLLSLIGVESHFTDVKITMPALGESSGAYVAAAKSLDVRMAPFDLTVPGIGRVPIMADVATGQPAAAQLRLSVDNNGRLLGGVEGDDFVLTGWASVELDDYVGVLLTGEIEPNAFGFDEQSRKFDALFRVTGGLLADVFFAGRQIGLTMDLSGAGGYAAGRFASDFSSDIATGELAAVDPMVVPPPQDPQLPPAEEPAPTPVTPLHAGQTASICFWRGKQGQKLLKSVNAGLGDWLAGTYPNLFGTLAGRSNAQVAELYRSKFAWLAGLKHKAKMLATAFAVYVTKQGLGGSAAAQHGFEVSSDGAGAATFTVGRNGPALGFAEGTSITVNDALAAADRILGGKANHRTQCLMSQVFSRLLAQGSRG